jgi:hypothetical protein
MKGSIRRVMRVALRHKKRLLVAALCATSFVAGQMLFGEETQPKPSRISEYLQAKIRLASGTGDEALTPAKAPASATTSSRRAASSSEPATSASDKSAASRAPDDFRQALQQAVAGEKSNEAPGSGAVQVVANPLPLETKPAGDENLPPIIPASAMPRPRPRQPVIAAQPSSAPAGSRGPATIAPTKIQTPKPAPWRINLGGKPLPAISVDEQETPPPPPGQAPANPQGHQSPVLPPSPNDRWNSQPNSAAAQAEGAVANPFVAPRNTFGAAPRAESGAPRTLFPNQVPPMPPGGIAPPAGPEISAAPRPYPMPLEIINPNVSRRPVVPAGSTEPVRTVSAAPPVITAQAAGTPGESNPLRASYHEPGLLVAPVSTDAAAKESPADNLKRIEVATSAASERGEAKQKSSRRRYMLEK